MAGDADDPVLVTVTASTDALPGTSSGTVKITALADIPIKGRGTGGVRCHKFLRGEDHVAAAWAGSGPVLAASPSGAPLDITFSRSKRDASGLPVPGVIATLSGPVRIEAP